MDEDFGSDYADREADSAWEKENNQCLDCGGKLDKCGCDEEIV